MENQETKKAKPEVKIQDYAIVKELSAWAKWNVILVFCIAMYFFIQTQFRGKDMKFTLVQIKETADVIEDIKTLVREDLHAQDLKYMPTNSKQHTELAKN